MSLLDRLPSNPGWMLLAFSVFNSLILPALQRQPNLRLPVALTYFTLASLAFGTAIYLQFFHQHTQAIALPETATSGEVPGAEESERVEAELSEDKKEATDKKTDPKLVIWTLGGFSVMAILLGTSNLLM